LGRARYPETGAPTHGEIPGNGCADARCLQVERLDVRQGRLDGRQHGSDGHFGELSLARRPEGVEVGRNRAGDGDLQRVDGRATHGAHAHGLKVVPLAIPEDPHLEEAGLIEGALDARLAVHELGAALEGGRESVLHDDPVDGPARGLALVGDGQVEGHFLTDLVGGVGPLGTG